MRYPRNILLAIVPVLSCSDGAGVGVDSSSSTSASTTTTSPAADDTTAKESTESGSSESSSTTGPMPCVSDEECTDAEAPFCGMTGECGTCDGAADPDGACRDADRLLPLCVGDACVQCTAAAPEACTGTTPVCDEATNTCVPCDAHDQCGEAACNLYTGACLPRDANAIAHVGPGQEIASLNEAVISFPGTEGTVVVHQADFNEAVTVDGGRTVAFLAADGDLPVWGLLAGGAPQLTVTAGSTVLMDGLQVSGNASGLGLQVDGGRAWVDRSRIIQNTGGGIAAVNGAELTVRNCFVGRNGDEFADTRGIAATDSILDVRYTTIAANDGTGASGPVSMACDAASSGEVRNSIVAAGDDTIACANVSFSFNVVDTPGLMGSANDVLSFQPSWFPNIAMADFHITMGPPFADVAQWSTGDPSIDIDGDPRPAVDGTPDYAGADVPQ